MAVEWRWALGAAVVLMGCGQVPDHTLGSAIAARSCFDCHGDRYLATITPNHVDRGFPTSCEGCHATTAWQPAIAGNHDFWPLTGAHVTATCESCHANGYQGTPTACEGCHLADYQATSAPDHETGAFPTSCESCHSTEAWTPAAYDHNQYWPLLGKHATASCESCHIGGVYAGTPKQCVGCHQADYLGTTTPSHTQLNLSTACETCHTPTSWATNTFPGHDPLFPIASGKHRNFTCSECHTTTSTFSEFTCTGCHTGEHNLQRMNQKHEGEVRSYQATLDQYGVDRGCLHCHPDGRGD